MNITYFTAGTIGAGHVVRGVALGHALRRAGHRGTYRIVAPASPLARVAGDAFVPVTVDPAALAQASTADASDVARVLRDHPMDVLVVDMFWAPLFHVLPLLRVPAWLLLRWVPPAWLRGPPGAPFRASSFARVLATEPAPLLSAFQAIPPVVMDDGQPAAPRTELAARLGVDADAPLHVVAHAGQPGEVSFLLDHARQHHPGTWSTWDLHGPGAPFPASRLLRAADRVCVAGGYNACWESRLFRYADRCVYVPRARPLDNQAWRVGLPADAWPDGNGADVLAQLLLNG